jgi:hypothetical protein
MLDHGKGRSRKGSQPLIWEGRNLECVVIICKQDGKTLLAVFRTEAKGLGFIRNRVAPGTELMADESGAWNGLHGRYAITTRKPTAWPGPAPMAPKSSSPGCAALRSGITTISPGHTSSGTRKKRHGERTTAGWIMGRKCRGGQVWPWQRGLRWISAGIGSGQLTSKQKHIAMSHNCCCLL